MAEYKYSLKGKTYTFATLGELLSKATPPRSGDQLAGIAATSELERVVAQYALADLPLSHFAQTPLNAHVAYEADEVTRLICDSWNEAAFAPLAAMSVGEFREFLLDHNTTSDTLAKLSPGLMPEMVAAVSKLLRQQELVSIAQKITVTTSFRSTVGQKGTLAVRLQPNHPTDDLKGIAASIIDGLLYGCGDAVIGINPATDSVHKLIELQNFLDDLISNLGIPTQSCILGHITNQMEAINQGAPLDLMFQSIAGTEKTNKCFGVNVSLLYEAHDAALSLERGSGQVMYFETGQGSCLSANGHFGLDQQTLEARAYGLARAFDPFLVNTVVGFIGPEYLFDGKQIIRAGLEDHFCGKILGLPMGCDVCYTNHAHADQDDMDNLLTLLGVAGCNYIMGVPGADDIMLSYQSTSFHDAQYIRQVLNLTPAPEFTTWLKKVGIYDHLGRLNPPEESHHRLQSTWRKMLDAIPT